MSKQLTALTIHKGLLEKLARLDQEADLAKAAALFNEAEECAFDALLNDEHLWSDGNRGSWRRRWRALRAKYRPTLVLSSHRI